MGGALDKSHRLCSLRGGRARRLPPGAGPRAPGGVGTGCGPEGAPYALADTPVRLEVSARPPGRGKGWLPLFQASLCFRGSLRHPDAPRPSVDAGEHTEIFPAGVSGTWTGGFLPRASALVLLFNKTDINGGGGSCQHAPQPALLFSSDPRSLRSWTDGCSLPGPALPGAQGGSARQGRCGEQTSGSSPSRRGRRAPGCPACGDSALPQRGQRRESSSPAQRLWPCDGRKIPVPGFPRRRDPAKGRQEGKEHLVPSTHLARVI